MIFKKHISNQKQVSNLKHQKHSQDGSAIIKCQFKVGEEKKRKKIVKKAKSLLLKDGTTTGSGNPDTTEALQKW